MRMLMYIAVQYDNDVCIKYFQMIKKTDYTIDKNFQHYPHISETNETMIVISSLYFFMNAFK